MERALDTIHHPFMIKSLHPLGIGVVLDYFPKMATIFPFPYASSRTCRNLLSRMQ